MFNKMNPAQKLIAFLVCAALALVLMVLLARSRRYVAA